MTRKILTIAATALVFSALSFAPPSAEAASIAVSAGVGSAAVITGTTDAATLAWTGIAPVSIPFTVSVLSNDALGYAFTFTGTNAATGPFVLVSIASALQIPYTVSGVTFGEFYPNGAPGASVYPGPTAPGGNTSTFDVNLPTMGGVPVATYTDTLIATVSPG